MHVLSLFVLVVPVLATPVVQTGQQYEPVSFNNCELVLDHNVDTYVVGMRFTLEPANVACAASNFSMPSPTFSCADIGYAFSINKTEGYYSRYTVRISHKLMSREVLQGDLTFGTNGPIPWLHEQIGTAEGELVAV